MRACTCVCVCVYALVCVHEYASTLIVCLSPSRVHCSSGSHVGGSGLSVLHTLFSLWSDELSLYYHLFPEEKDCHKQYVQDGQEHAAHSTLTQTTHTHL